MKDELKYVSKKTARRLKEYDFPQDTTRWWVRQLTSELWELCDDDYPRLMSEIFAAPDAQEIAEQLPFRAKWDTDVTGVFSNDWLPGEAMSPGGGGQRFFHFFYRGDQNIHLHDKTFSSENEAEARAACWLYLKENKLL